jgi:hypothetical protein
MQQQVCSACDAPFVAVTSRPGLPICGQCRTKMQRLCDMPLKKLASEENEALARSMVELGAKLRKAFKESRHHAIA